jgi:hypothetical protein
MGHSNDHLHVHHYHYPDGTYIIRAWINNHRIEDGDEVEIADYREGHPKVINQNVEYYPCSVTEEVYHRKTNRRAK